MKKILLVGAFALIANFGFAQVAGSAHDFSAWATNVGTGQTEICIPCHTPHNADGTVAEAPLWNHEVTTESFIPYSNTTMSVAPGQPGGVSVLCLSCHDGTIALDAFGGAAGTPASTIGSVNAAADFGIDLSNDHPISFAYTTTDGGGLFDPLVGLSGMGSTIDYDMLFTTNVECASCHDVHNAPGGGAFNLLVKDNANSALCLTCHNK